MRLQPEQQVALTGALKQEAERLGFPLHGVCVAEEVDEWERLCDWIRHGYAGEMHYLPDRLPAYRHPDAVLAGVRSLLMLGMPYRSEEAQPPDAGQGQVSRYAWGSADYHDVIHLRLKQLKQFVHKRYPGAAVRGVVDSAPLLERQLAERAGLGWRGKNTLLLNRKWGSWFFLAALLTDLPLQPDEPFESDHCGTCRACLDACPTDAFPQPYVLDATRCISYLTIEKRGEIDASLRPEMQQWLFGCDVCQDVCPWNQRAPTTEEAQFLPRADMNPVELAELFTLTDEQFRERFRRTPLWRSKRQGILRNAAVVLGNRGSEAHLPALARGVRDADPVVREASSWALAELGTTAARKLLRAALDTEPLEPLRQKLRRYCGC